MVTPAFSHAWISADPASIDTFLPSTVNSTSARRLGVVLKGFARAGSLEGLRSGLNSCLDNMAEVVQVGRVGELKACGNG